MVKEKWQNVLSKSRRRHRRRRIRHYLYLHLSLSSSPYHLLMTSVLLVSEFLVVSRSRFPACFSAIGLFDCEPEHGSAGILEISRFSGRAAETIKLYRAAEKSSWGRPRLVFSAFCLNFFGCFYVFFMFFVCFSFLILFFA